MNPQGTIHIFLSTDRKSAFLLISCTQSRAINPQPTSMNLCLPDKSDFKKAYDSARTALNCNQRRRNALYNRKVHGPTYHVNQKVLLHNPVVPVGKSPKFFSPRKGPYVILQCLNEVTYRIQESATQKELVHYDRLKSFHEPPPTSKLPTRDKRNPKNILPRKAQQQEPSIPEYDHDQCTWHYPYHTVP